MKIAGVAETITVSGGSPLVDTKATGTATNFTSDELTKIPTSRDPFALMRTVPGVLVDRVNVGGNETGQQSNFASKGTRPQDAVWTIDGIVVTDMTATGASPTYFNYDNFEEIQVATAGQDIKQPTGGLGLNLVVKCGTNQFHGMARGYFDNDTLSASNVPAELAAQGVTPDTADHNKQISDSGFDFGGPILRDKAWFYASYSIQDIRLVRQAARLTDRTELKDPDVKLNWQATRKDMVSFRSRAVDRRAETGFWASTSRASFTEHFVHPHTSKLGATDEETRSYFIRKELPRCAIVRPTSRGQIDAIGAITGFMARRAVHRTKVQSARAADSYRVGVPRSCSFADRSSADVAGLTCLSIA